MLTEKELVELNREKAENWLKNCPKCHKLKKYEAIVRKHAAGRLVERDGQALTLMIGDQFERPHEKWAPQEVPYCEVWEINREARAAHDEKIHDLRHRMTHFSVISDIASLRIEADGVEMLFGHVGSDGDHKVWITERQSGERGTLLSLDGKSSDNLLAVVKAKNLKIFWSDCSGDDVVYAENNDGKETYDIYAVTNGWKIEKVIERA